MIPLLVTIILILMACVAVSVFYVLKFARIILSIEETLEVGLQELDASYNKMSDILEKPIFFDSIEVRQVVDEIVKARNLLLKMATALTGSILATDEEDDVDEKNSGP